MWLILEGQLSEDVTAHTALIDDRALAIAKPGDDKFSRPDPRLFDYEVQVSALGGATSVTIEVMGPAGIFEDWATGVIVGPTVVITTGWWRQVRLTWTGGAPNGTGAASFSAAPKFNGLG